jgi:PAS domain S-box-containing protein
MGPENDAQFRVMFERSADAILLLDTSSNRFVEYNQATLDMLRCSREELRALHPSELSPPRQPDGRDSYESANERIAAAIRSGSTRFEWIHRSPHREDFPVEVLLTSLQGGTSPLLLVVWRDITERKRNEEALRQAQKVESLGVLAGGVAHDLNNLLTVMNGHLALARAAPDARSTREHLALVERAVTRATDLSRQMLAYSGHTALAIEPVDLDQAVREMAALLSAAVTNVGRLTHEPSPVSVIVEANRTELSQVIMNLVTNAAEASGPGGSVVVRTLALELDEATLARDFVGQGLEAGRYCMLQVVDQGLGMSDDVLARMLDPFFSTKGPGRGLGLSTVMGIVRSRRGGLRVRSQLGAGTEFSVVFPASARSPSPALPDAPTAPEPKGEGLVLLVDDQPNVRRSVRGLLELLGFRVLEAVDGESALDLLRLDARDVRWVLMDLTMPGLDGHETFVAMRALDPTVKVILSSGWAQSQLAARFLADPPLAFLRKPFRLDELVVLLEGVGLLAPRPTR